jgi:hypothetical protein
MNCLRKLVLFSLALNGSASAFAQLDVPQLLMQHYPQHLLARELEWKGEPLSRNTCYALVGDEPDPDFIIAGYARGAIVIFERSAPGQYALVSQATSEDYLMGNDYCDIELVDLDGHGRHEILASFYLTEYGKESWFFSWENSRLQYIGPPDAIFNGRVESRIVNASLIDLDNDGQVEVVTRVHESEPVEDLTEWQMIRPRDLYSLRDGVLRKTGTIIYVRGLLRHKAKPQEQIEVFGLAHPPTTPVQLRLFNGKFGGARRVSSARVMLNGVEIASPRDFNQQVDVLARQVRLKKKNELKVLLDGAPDSSIRVVIEPSK